MAIPPRTQLQPEEFSQAAPLSPLLLGKVPCPGKGYIDPLDLVQRELADARSISNDKKAVIDKIEEELADTQEELADAQDAAAFAEARANKVVAIKERIIAQQGAEINQLENEAEEADEQLAAITDEVERQQTVAEKNSLKKRALQDVNAKLIEKVEELQLRAQFAEGHNVALVQQVQETQRVNELLQETLDEAQETLLRGNLLQDVPDFIGLPSLDSTLSDCTIESIDVPQESKASVAEPVVKVKEEKKTGQKRQHVTPNKSQGAHKKIILSPEDALIQQVLFEQFEEAKGQGK